MNLKEKLYELFPHGYPSLLTDGYDVQWFPVSAGMEVRIQILHGDKCHVLVLIYQDDGKLVSYRDGDAWYQFFL